MTAPRILTVNAGSSSIKIALYENRDEPARVLKAHLSGIGTTSPTFSSTVDGRTAESPADAPDVSSAAAFILAWLDDEGVLDGVGGVGHRVVHGLDHPAPARMTDELVGRIRRAAPYAPQHLPAEIELIEALAERRPALPQVACFDTAFHHDMPRVATLLPLPHRYQDDGMRRYGFHGLSCAYLVEELARLAGREAAAGRVLIAHLGNGASITAVKHGRSLDTSMGFTPAAGLVMSTRTGDLDPGIVLHLARTEQMSAAAFDRLVNRESGLLGVSGTSSDMRELLAREATDGRAADAVALFCYQARKWIGGLTTVLGGVDTLIFSAGIGERSAAIRSRICEGLQFLGLDLDPGRNDVHDPVISTPRSPVTVRVIPTNEELMIARTVIRMLASGADKEPR